MKRGLILSVLVFIFVGSVPFLSADTPVTGCMTFSTAGERYYLEDNLTITQRSNCFHFNYGQDKVFDLNGYTLTYDDSPIVNLLNPSFESGSGSVASNWDFSNAPQAARTNNRRFFRIGGDYTLVFPAGSTSGQYVESDPITVQAGVSYHAHFLYFGNGQPYLTLPGVSGSCSSPTVASTTPNAWTFYSCSFTPSSTTSSPVRIGINGGPTQDLIIDLVEVSPRSEYSFISSVSGTSGLTIMNGTIVKGSANGYGGNVIGLTISSGDSRARIHDVVFNVSGTGVLPISLSSSNNMEIYDNEFYMTGKYALDRELLYGMVKIGNSANVEVHHNKMVGGFQSGIVYSGASNAHAHDNEIIMNTGVTNGFAIEVYGTSGVAQIYNNNISGYGRGIHMGGSTSGAEVYGNTIDMMEFVNPEYPNPYNQDTQGVCAQAIKIEGRDDTHIYDNYAAMTDTPETYIACPLNIGSGDRPRVYNNTIVARSSSSPTSYFEPSAIYFLGTDGSTGEVFIENNTLYSDGATYFFLGEVGMPGARDVVFKGNTIIDTDGTDTFETMYLGGWPPDQVATNVTLLDNIFTGSVDPRNEGIADNAVTNWDFTVAWTLSVEAFVDGLPASGATVTIVDNQGTTVLSNAPMNGNVLSIPLPEFRHDGSSGFSVSETTYSPYDISVTYLGDTQTQNSVVLNQPMTLQFNFGAGGGNAYDVNSDSAVNIIDLVLVSFWQGDDASQRPHLDVNQDGQIGWSDVLEVLLRV